VSIIGLSESRTKRVIKFLTEFGQIQKGRSWCLGGDMAVQHWLASDSQKSASGWIDVSVIITWPISLQPAVAQRYLVTHYHPSDEEVESGPWRGIPSPDTTAVRRDLSEWQQHLVTGVPLYLALVDTKNRVRASVFCAYTRFPAEENIQTAALSSEFEAPIASAEAMLAGCVHETRRLLQGEPELLDPKWLQYARALRDLPALDIQQADYIWHNLYFQADRWGGASLTRTLEMAEDAARIFPRYLKSPATREPWLYRRCELCVQSEYYPLAAPFVVRWKALWRA